jgi:hypothetical protein
VSTKLNPTLLCVLQGNAMPEELGVLHYAKWDGSKKLVTRPTTPGDWSWPNETGKKWRDMALLEPAFGLSFDKNHQAAGMMMIQWDDDRCDMVGTCFFIYLF